MNDVCRLAASVAFVTLLFGCAAQPPAAPTSAATAAPAATPIATNGSGSFDGVYRAKRGGSQGNPRCGTSTFGYPIRVVGGVASMASVMNGTLEGPVGPDGSLAIEKGRAGLRGQFANGEFNGVYGSGGGCAFTLAYSKR